MDIIEALKQAPSVDDVPVEISYRIIELFSEGLYRSPYKAVEELIVNGYDAMATTVHVLLRGVDKSDGMIVVIDNGESMDPDGLRLLWQIGATNKRSDEFEQRLWEARKRRPIGKFGIGKLASYVLAKHLVYVTKRDGKFWAIDMDFGKIEETDKGIERDGFQRLVLPLRELKEEQAREVLRDAQIQTGDTEDKRIILLGEKAEPSWTVAVMTDLKELAGDIQEGRLRYIVSTGLPIRPDFSVYINGEEVEPYRAKGERIWEARIGEEDIVAKNLELETDVIEVPSNLEPQPAVKLPTLGWIWGMLEVFRDTITSLEGRKRKAELLGRSHGFFIMVRERLVNLEDPLFGLPPLSHRTFNRFRMVVHCDRLDDILRSSRESVLESQKVRDELWKFLRGKFNEADRKYEDWLEAQVEEGIRRLPPLLLREPIRALARQAASGERPVLLSNLPSAIISGEIDLNKWIDETLQEPTLEEVFEIADVTGIPYIAYFNAELGKIVINTAHPFVASYLELFKQPEPLYQWALAEILLEAYLYDEGVSPLSTTSVIGRRNRFFREIVRLGRKSAIVIARELHEAVDDQKGLETAVGEALDVLGFDVTPMGQSGKPDGIAYAYPGRLPRKKYSLIYDAKSTTGEKVRPNIGRTDTHRRQQEAQYAIIVGRDFPKGNLGEEAKKHRITLCKVKTLARLLEASVKKPVGFSKLEGLLENCHIPDEVDRWVEDFARNATEARAIERFSAILEAIGELQKDESFKGTVRINGLYTQLRNQGLHGLFEDEEDLGEWLRAMKRLVPNVVMTENDRVFLDTSPDLAIQHIQAQLIGVCS